MSTVDVSAIRASFLVPARARLPGARFRLELEPLHEHPELLDLQLGIATHRERALERASRREERIEPVVLRGGAEVVDNDRRGTDEFHALSISR